MVLFFNLRQSKGPSFQLKIVKESFYSPILWALVTFRPELRTPRDALSSASSPLSPFSTRRFANDRARSFYRFAARARAAGQNLRSITTYWSESTLSS